MDLKQAAREMRATHGDVRVSAVDGIALFPAAVIKRWLKKRLPLMLAHGTPETTIGVALSWAEEEEESDLQWMLEVCKRAVRRSKREEDRRC